MMDMLVDPWWYWLEERGVWVVATKEHLRVPHLADRGSLTIVGIVIDLFDSFGSIRKNYNIRCDLFDGSWYNHWTIGWWVSLLLLGRGSGCGRILFTRRGRRRW